ncbi:MAG TPA: cupin domain-containing protein [Gemmataceae bacterium]|nr:cupin domain-containing protein [Gemmataceae bacterium]
MEAKDRWRVERPAGETGEIPGAVRLAPSRPRGRLFLVVQGRFRMEFRDRHVWLKEGEFLIVPRGVEHRPVADEEAHVLLFEPASTLNTGNMQNERTVAQLDRI